MCLWHTTDMFGTTSPTLILCGIASLCFHWNTMFHKHQDHCALPAFRATKATDAPAHPFSHDIRYLGVQRQTYVPPTICVQPKDPCSTYEKCFAFEPKLYPWYVFYLWTRFYPQHFFFLWTHLRLMLFVLHVSLQYSSCNMCSTYEPVFYLQNMFYNEAMLYLQYVFYL